MFVGFCNKFIQPQRGGKQSSPALGGLKCMILLHSTNIIAALRLENLRTHLIFRYTAMLCLLFCAIQVKAQTYLGFRGGVNFANVTNNANKGRVTDERIIGILAGAYIDAGISDHISIQSEFGFIQRGFTRRISSSDKLVYKLSYLDLDVLFKYSLRNINKNPRSRKWANANLLVGPYSGWALSGRIADKDDDAVKPVDFMEDFGLIRLDLGLLAGVGLEIPVGNGYLIFDLRYHFGLMPITEFHVYNEGHKNRGIVASAGYALQIGR